MWRRLEGMILVETMTALVVLTIGIGFLELNIAQTKQILLAQNQRVDVYLAARMMRLGRLESVTVHDREYTEWDVQAILTKSSE
ncbi:MULTISPECIES: type IV pilus modification PilV family protein [Amylolactobacillus]|nr:MULTISPECIES: hypothetical protein [Amylolactobacillus]GED79951.1 hypothetical protein LAM01_04240 [Amylolactobacillus amylophilus]